MPERCKENVMTGFHYHRCMRNAVKDGYCKQHHPESVKERHLKSEKLYKEKLKNSPWRKLEKATKEIANLKKALKQVQLELKLTKEKLKEKE